MIRVILRDPLTALVKNTAIFPTFKVGIFHNADLALTHQRPSEILPTF
jgi:hypothetical protein